MENFDPKEREMYEAYMRMTKQGKSGDSAPSAIVCPARFEKPCRLCDLCKEVLFDKNQYKGKPIYGKASELNRKQRYYSNVVFPLGNPGEIVVLEYGDMIFKKLLKLHMAPTSEYKNFMHPTEGRNIIIIKTPGATPQQTQYDVRPRVAVTKLIDMSVLSKLFPLDQVLDLINNGLKVYYQSKLPNEETEVRFLPSWLGPQFTQFFYQIDYHYKITEEEFAAVQRGDFDPLRDTHAEPPQTTGSMTISELPKQDAQSTPVKEKSPWERFLNPPSGEQKQEEVVAEELTKRSAQAQDDLPPCYGSYDPNDIECTKGCADDGWAESCQQASKRRQARRLQK